MAAPTPFAARAAELGRVLEALDGRPACGVLVTGAPGAGASRLVLEGAKSAEAAGAAVAVVHGSAALSDVLFAAFAPVLINRGEPGADLLLAAHAWAEGFAAGKGLVVVADAVHRFDPATAAVVAELGWRHPILATAPAAICLPPSFAELRRSGRLVDVTLAPLEEGGVAELAEARLGGPVDRRVVRELRTRWGGNVRHTLAQLATAVDAGELTESLGLWRLVRDWGFPPATVAEVTADLDGLDEDERTAVELLALGEPLGLDLLRALCPAGTIDRLDDRGWLDIGRDGRRRPVTLRDRSVATVVAGTIPTLRAAARTDAVLDALDATGWRRADDPLVRSGLLTRTGRTLTAPEMLDAGRAARFGRRLDLAEELARQAHAAAGGWEAAYLLGEILEERGRREEAERFYVDYAKLASTPDERALVAMATAVNRYYGLNRRDDAEAEVAAALNELRGTEWEAELECLLAVFAMFRGRVDEAIAVARRHFGTSTGRGWIEAATVLGPALSVAGRCDEAYAIAQRACDERQALGDQYVLGDYGLHLVTMANARLESGHVTEALHLGDLITEASVIFGDRDGQAWGDLIVGRARMLAGDIGGAEAALREAAVLFADLDYLAQLRWAKGSLAMATAFAGDTEAAAAASVALDLVESGWGYMEADMLRAQAWVTAAHGDLAAARVRVLEAVELARTTGHRTIAARALHDLVRLGDPRGPAEVLDDMADEIDGPMMPLLVRYRRALAASDADELLAVASDLAALGLGLYGGEAAYQASAQLGREGRRRAAAHAAQTAASYLPVGSTLRTPAVLAAGGGANPLTQRERDVATLAAEGLASKEIAAKLSVSVRTVDNLLQRAYRKLGVSSRSELRARLR